MDEKLLRDLEMLTDLMKQDGWKSLRVSGGEISVDLGEMRGEIAFPRNSTVAPVSAQQAPTKAAHAPALEPVAPTDMDPAWFVMEAPNLGTFYRSPKPGSPPFVEVGQRVESGTELCLIEVMKLFTSVRADCSGTIRHIAAADAELVEGGQPLMYIEPE